jgi:hypothetical protein
LHRSAYDRHRASEEHLTQVAFPAFVIDPRRSFPPDEFCFGTSPSHAAMLRPHRNIDGSGTQTTSAEATSGPMPGIFISRRQSSVEQASVRI